jgi:Protein of unknown function (DUF3071)
MRTARLVGLSPDGKSLIVATESGEELAVAVDERLHATLRGDRPRVGQLEIEMESSLTPRDIQSRIRAGSTLEAVAEVAGIPLDRVERFAGPVLAEREHMARLAMTSSVRRRGETSGHRSLRMAVNERLAARGVDADSIVWDSYRLSDGRWTVTVDYQSGDVKRHATFVFDASGRFSIAEDEEARWLLGEQSAHKPPQPGRRRPVVAEAQEDVEDTEPTLNLSDEMALVRAVRETEVPPEPHLTVVDDLPAESARDFEQDYQDAPDEAASRSPMGLSDAIAVPDTSNQGWEPAIVVNYPVEPSLLDESEYATGVDPDAAELSGEPGSAEHSSWLDQFGTVVPEHPDDHSVTGVVVGPAHPGHAPAVEQHHHLRGTDEPGMPDRPTGIEDREDEEKEFVEESQAEESHVTESGEKPGKRKRASVPSWDEIMFGGPKRG